MKLECRGICKSFGGVQALVDVSIAFPTEGIVAIIGPNGAGKTTLIDTLTGIVEPDEGCWLLDERNITGLSTTRVTKLGIARSFQGIRLLLDETVLDNVSLAMPDERSETLHAALLHFRRSTRKTPALERASTMAGLVGLNGRRHDYVRSLSYGEQKLVSAVVTDATGAGVLLLDEPMAGVHGEGGARIATLAKELASRGRLIIFVEHDMDAVRQLADIVVVMDQGRVLTMGKTAEVLERRDLLEAYLG